MKNKTAHFLLIIFQTSPYSIGPASLCSGHGDTKISGCQGDSGGPFVCRKKSDQKWYLRGVVSWGSQR